MVVGLCSRLIEGTTTASAGDKQMQVIPFIAVMSLFGPLMATTPNFWQGCPGEQPASC